MQAAGACFLAAVVMAAVSVGATAQERSATTTLPQRIANHYNHKAYQPTIGEVCGGAKASGVNCSSAAGAKAGDELDRIRQQIEAQERQYPPVPSAQLPARE